LDLKIKAKSSTQETLGTKFERGQGKGKVQDELMFPFNFQSSQPALNHYFKPFLFSESITMLSKLYSAALLTLAFSSPIFCSRLDSEFRVIDRRSFRISDPELVSLEKRGTDFNWRLCKCFLHSLFRSWDL
jgi:hypothetical protein